MKYKAEIKVLLKEGIKDSHGLAIESVLKSINISQNAKVKTGKLYCFTIESEDKESAYNQINNICEKILVNPVNEKFEIINFEEEKSIDNLISELAS